LQSGPRSKTACDFDAVQLEYLKQSSTSQRMRCYRKWGDLHWTCSLL